MDAFALVLIMAIAFYFVVEVDNWMTKNRNHFGDK